MASHFPNLIDTSHSVHLAHLDDTPAHRSGLYRLAGKRLLDTLLVLVSLPVALPLILGLALILTLRDGRNPFYNQKRIGRGGRIFTMWKLRTMVPQADQKLQAYLAANPAARAEWDDTQKLKNDPRITPLGRLLRKTSIDELPQLLNVLTGDMSLVGPRPMLPEQQSLYPGRAYYALRPGITGSWQISDRNEGFFAGRAQFDTDYDRALSLTTDVAILVATVRVVLNATGY